MRIAAWMAVLAMTLDASSAADSGNNIPGRTRLDRMTARFATAQLKVDVSRLAPADRQALARLIEAARHIDTLYMAQLWGGNLDLYARLRRDKSPLGAARLHYFWMNKGPWSDLDDHAAFIPGVPARRPPGANFYPAGMTRAEFDAWVAGLAPPDRELARGFFSVIQRDKDGKLAAVPYNTAYKSELEPLAALLRQAAALTTNATLRRFLEARAAAFISNDYYESDIAWMDLDAPLDITIGPYETYTDEIFGYKAAFEAYVNLRDDAETQKVAFFSDHLQEVENNLPIDPAFRNPKLGAQAPIRVVNQIFCAGDGAHGVQTAAYNLPNDERVIQQKGSKRVMLRNVQEAKFHHTLKPIAARVLDPASLPDLSFDLFFTHTLAHELSHGIGPHTIQVAGRASSARQELKELYSAIEEAKADITGLFMLQHLIDHGLWGGAGAEARRTERRLYTTFFASAFRSVRFGLNEAHGKGMALQFNYLVEKGAYRELPGGGYAIDWERMKPAVRDLTHHLLTIEARGDYAAARRMLDKYAVMAPAMKRVIDGLSAIPTDIAPVFVTAGEIAPWPLPVQAPR
jgi:hypothetical protein